MDDLAEPALPHHIAQIVNQRLVEIAHVQPDRALGFGRSGRDGLGIGLCLSFYLLTRVQHGNFASAARGNGKYIVLAGVFDAVSLLFQLASYAYIPVVITVSIKRAGIVLAVFAGWLFFRERGITDKVIAASVMFCGVLILYLKVTPGEALGIVAATLIGMTIALYATREKTA